MKERILESLAELESTRNIKILLACETGSRAWGFESPDSDYDIRIIYRHPLDWYVSVYKHKDYLSVMQDNNLIDITGWELRKTLGLLTKSNMAVFERLDSPIIYRAEETFCDQLAAVAPNFFNPKAAIYHYLGLAKSAHDDLTSSEGDFKLKRLFYGLRSAAACQWIYEERPAAPPIVFSQILDKISIAESAKTRINELVLLKAGESETYMHSGEAELLELIKTQIETAEKAADLLPTPRPDRDLLDSLFKKTLLGE